MNLKNKTMRARGAVDLSSGFISVSSPALDNIHGTNKTFLYQFNLFELSLCFSPFSLGRIVLKLTSDMIYRTNLLYFWIVQGTGKT